MSINASAAYFDCTTHASACHTCFDTLDVIEPDVLLLDEPTAHLDRRGERRVLDALSALLEQRDVTVIAASHRPEMLDRADRVLRIEQGRVTGVSAG